MNSILLPEKCPGALGSMALAYLKAMFKVKLMVGESVHIRLKQGGGTTRKKLRAEPL